MAEPIHFSDRMSDSDAVLWAVESDPQLRSTITSVWVLDSSPDRERFARKIERCSLEIPRLRQRAVSDPFGIAPPRWEIDPFFDLDFHLRRLSLPAGSSLRDLLDLAEPIGMQAFDRDRPLWELYQVDGLDGGRSAIIMKLHHAISDGVGLVRMTKSMVERSRIEDASERSPLPKAPDPVISGDLDRSLDALAWRSRKSLERGSSLAASLGSGLERLLRQPAATLQGALAEVASVGRLMAPVREPLSPLLRGRSISQHFDTLEVPLADLKRAANAVGGTLNDGFVAAVSGGLRRYHEHLGAPVDELRMNMPINLRSGSTGNQAGNQFAPVRFAVPVGIVSPAERMVRIHELVAKQRAEPALPLLDGISGAIGSLPGSGPAWVAGSMMKAIDFTTSNVPGPRFPVFVSGARIENMFGFGPLAGGAANITCFSYDGNLGIGVNLDPSAVSDPSLLVECLGKGMEEVLTVV